LLDSDNNRLKYVCHYSLVNAKTELSQYDTECLGFCLEQLEAYYKLAPEQLKIIEVNKYSTYTVAIKKMDQCLEKLTIDQKANDELTNGIYILKYYSAPFKETNTEQRSKNKFTLLRWNDTAIIFDFTINGFY